MSVVFAYTLSHHVASCASRQSGIPQEEPLLLKLFTVVHAVTHYPDVYDEIVDFILAVFCEVKIECDASVV